MVTVCKDIINSCYEFAEKMVKRDAASPKQFGRKDIQRKKNDLIADHVVGKAVEFGFNDFLNQKFGITFNVDTEVWDGHHNHDNGNDLATINVNGQIRAVNFKTDIKGSRNKSAWLLVERHKIVNFQTNVYVVGKATNVPYGNGFESNPAPYRNMDWKIEIMGYAFDHDLMDRSADCGWIEFSCGEKLIRPRYLSKLKYRLNKIPIQQFHQEVEQITLQNRGTEDFYMGPPLDCEMNYGLPIRWLRNSNQDWLRFYNKLIKESQPLN